MAAPSFLGKLSRKLLGIGEQKVALFDLPEKELLVEKATLELQATQSLFDNVTEKDLIDHAIYKLNAAERRLVFLLQEARLQQPSKEKEEKGGYPYGEKQ